MGFKSFITNGWNSFTNKLQQGITGAKNVAVNAGRAVKQGVIGAKNFVVNNKEAISGGLSAMAPFIGAINPALGTAAAIGSKVLDAIPNGNVKTKLENVKRRCRKW